MLSFKVIVDAMKGNAIAIEEVLKHFEGYIVTLSTIKLTDEFGSTYNYVDESIRRRLEIKLITAVVMKFQLENV